MRHISINTFYFLALVVGLSSCLKKSDKTIMDPDNAGNIIEFANTGDNVSGSSSKYPRFTTDLGSMKDGESKNFNLNLNYSGKENAPSDITLTLALDPEALALYNTQNGTDFEIPPADVFDFPETVVIEQGTRKTTVEATVTMTPSFDNDKNYAIPLKIASASMGTISGNFGSAIYSFSVRNKLDGRYLVEALSPMVDLVAPSLTGYYPLNIDLITYTGSSVFFYDGELLGTAGHVIRSGSSLSYYGTFAPVFFFDKVTGDITGITNYYGQLAGGLKRSAVLDPTGVNKITFNADGTVKEFEVKYEMTQGDAYTTRTKFHEKFTFVSNRD